MPLAAALLLAIGLAVQSSQMPKPSKQLLAAAERLDEVIIDAAFDPESRSLRVIQELKLTNRTGEALTAAVLRTWPNAFQTMDHSPCAADEDWFEKYYPVDFSAGALVMERAEVNAEPVFHRYLDDAKTALNLPVPGSWQPNETIFVSLVYTVHIPHMAYRFGEWDGVWALGNAFAIPAVWEDGAFCTDPYAPVGDPFQSDCMNYDVWVSVPVDYMCAGSGYPAVDTVNGRRVYHFDSPAVRDFALVISDRFHMAQTKQNGVWITAYAPKKAQAQEMLKYAKKALKCYAQLYGDYPYPSCSLAQIALPHGGAEYPQLAMIGSGREGRDLEYVIAHEMAHQWWYAVVGSDGYHQPWQDEALCEYSVLDYAEKIYGLSEREDLEWSRMESAMRVTVSRGVTPGAPLDVYASMEEYRLVAYHRGAACLCALDRTVPGGLNGFLGDYYQNFAFLRASRADFERQLALSTGEDLAPLLRDYLDTNILN